jgi:NAD(P)H-hydrate epimerase
MTEKTPRSYILQQPILNFVRIKFFAQLGYKTSSKLICAQSCKIPSISQIATTKIFKYFLYITRCVQRSKNSTIYNRQIDMHIPALTTEQMVVVDRLMIEEYGIELIQMMENAGRNLADLTGHLLGASLPGQSVCVLCGRGNNGGGGMVAARHLHNRGADVHITRLSGDLKALPARQWRILENMGLRNDPFYDLSDADIIIDALIGYGLNGDPRPEVVVWIEKANAAGKPILVLDAPSGLDTTSGTPSKPTVRADATMTLALPKVGLMSESVKPFVGELYLADISVPPELYRKMGLEVQNIFKENTIIRIRK